MAWVSPKVYAILSSSEEGKDIIERLPDLSQDEAEKEIDAFFGEGGKGFASSEDYGKAKADYEAEENAYKSLVDAEIKEEEYEDKPEEVSEEEISEALADYQWMVTDKTKAGQFAQEVADKLGCSKEQVFNVIKQQAPDQIKEDSSMSKIIDAWEGNYEYKDEEEDKE